MIESLHPGLVLIGAGLALGALRGRARSALIVLAPAAAVALVLAGRAGPVLNSTFLGYPIVPYFADPLSRLFGLAFAVAALAGALFALRQPNRLEVPAAFVYAGAAIGVAFAGDLLTLFVFWEVMAIASTLVIWSAGTEPAYRASLRYIMVHLLGGVLLMAGIVGHIAATGSTAIERIALDSPATWLILAGVLVNAGAPPLSAWLPDAYPEATWSGTVFLSAFTTKAAVYVLLRGFPGAEVLVPIGLVMVFYGIVYGLLGNDQRRILAYGIVSQVGIMTVGIGIGTEMAQNGAAAHAVASLFYTALLMMAAGVVLHGTGRRDCTELGGLYRTMPLTTACAVIGALSICAFPLTSGFVSKAMVAQAALDEHRGMVALLLAAGSAGTLLFAGYRYPWFVFFNSRSDLRPRDPPLSQRLAMLLCAVLCIGLGVFPAPLYALLPYAVPYVPYTGAHVVGSLQLALFALLAFCVMLPLLKPTRTLTLDTDWFYRRLGPALLSGFGRGIARTDRWIRTATLLAVRATTGTVGQFLRPHGRYARAYSTGNMALLAAILLVAYLVLYYV